MTTLKEIEAKYKLGLDKAWRCGGVAHAAWFEDHESGTLNAVYTDGDGGVMLFEGHSEIFDEQGITVRLLGCTYCDITYDEMHDIVQELKEAI
tara:strand:+ start:264 stop:542 length:279 start_codon:yes stop_codon:yes gene_type:complete